MKQLLMAFLTVVVLAGCGNEMYDKAMEQAKLALAGGEFDKALASFELALEEKPKDGEAETAREQLIAYQEVEKAMENAQWDEAITKAQHLIGEEALASSIANEAEQSIKTAEANKAKNQAVSEKIKQIEGLVSAKDYKEAQNLIAELKQDEMVQAVWGDFSEEVERLAQTADEAAEKQKQEEAEALAAQKAAEQAAKKEAEELAAKKKAEAASRQSEYIGKLNAIEEGLADLDYLYANGITIEMKKAEAETYKRWDKALNEIYGVLKKQLSKSEMTALRNEQRDWITYRDNTAAEESAVFAGGTMESLQYISTQSRLTKERCYELVLHYMK